jgi:hypothetical protein
MKDPKNSSPKKSTTKKENNKMTTVKFQVEIEVTLTPMEIQELKNKMGEFLLPDNDNGNLVILAKESLSQQLTGLQFSIDEYEILQNNIVIGGMY